MGMDIDIIFKIAAIGIAIAVLNQILLRAGREEQIRWTTIGIRLSQHFRPDGMDWFSFFLQKRSTRFCLK